MRAIAVSEAICNQRIANAHIDALLATVTCPDARRHLQAAADHTAQATKQMAAVRDVLQPAEVRLPSWFRLAAQPA